MQFHQNGQSVQCEEYLRGPGPLHHEGPAVPSCQPIQLQHSNKQATYLIHRTNQSVSARLCNIIPPRDHRSHCGPLRQMRCIGRTSPELITIAASLSPIPHTLAVKRLQTRIRMGYPVSLMLRKTLVPTMMARPIQKRVKNPRKLW